MRKTDKQRLAILERWAERQKSVLKDIAIFGYAYVFNLSEEGDDENEETLEDWLMAELDFVYQLLLNPSTIDTLEDM